MTVRNSGFRSGFNHRDCEFAILWNTAKPSLKRMGEVKNVLSSRLRRMLAVDKRASGGAERLPDLARAISLVPVSMNLGVVAADDWNLHCLPMMAK